MGKESHNFINFIDLSTHRKEEELEFTVYRNPTQNRYHSVVSDKTIPVIDMYAKVQVSTI
jgi:hypothetical protein